MEMLAVPELPRKAEGTSVSVLPAECLLHDWPGGVAGVGFYNGAKEHPEKGTGSAAFCIGSHTDCVTGWGLFLFYFTSPFSQPAV